MKSGQILYENTNASLLNKLVGTNYDLYRKTTYKLSDETMIWMITIDGKINNGFRNIKQGDKIVEHYVGGKQKPKSFDTGWQVKKRLVFEKVRYYNSHYYVFLGVYRLDKDENNHCLRVLVKESDEYIFS